MHPHESREGTKTQQTPHRSEGLSKSMMPDGMTDDKPLFHENSGSYSSQQQQATRKTTIQQSNSIMAHTSGNETNQWQTSSGHIETAEGKQENTQQEFGKEQKNSDEVEREMNQEQIDATPQESKYHDLQREALQNSQLAQLHRMHLTQNKPNLNQNFVRNEQQQMPQSIQMMPMFLDTQFQLKYNKQVHSQQTSSRVRPNNSSRDSSQNTQRINQIQSKLSKTQDGFIAPQSRPSQPGQTTSQKIYQNQQANTAFMQQRLSNFAQKQIGSIGGGEGVVNNNHAAHSKESRKSRRSKQSKKSETTSYGKSSSLKQFQQQIPKKEYKDEMDTESQGESHIHRQLKIKAPQNIMSNILENDDSAMNCQHQQKTVQAQKNQSNANTPQFPSQSQFLSRESSRIAGQGAKNNNTQESNKKSSKKQYNDHSMLLFHNSNLSGLQLILRNLRSLTKPLDQLINVSQKLFDNHMVMKSPLDNSNAIQQLLEKAKNNEKMLEKYIESLQNSPANNNNISQSSAIQQNQQPQIQTQYSNFEESAVAPSTEMAPAMGPIIQSRFTGMYDRFGNPLKRPDTPISITFKKDQSSMIQKILHSYPMAGNDPEGVYGSKCSQIENERFRYSKPITNDSNHQNQVEAKCNKITSSGIEENNKRMCSMDKIEICEKQQQTSEMRAKAFLAQGFQLQDSVKISAQIFQRDVQEASQDSDSADNQDKMQIEPPIEDSRHDNVGMNNRLPVHRFMNVFENPQKNKNDNNLKFPREHSSNNFDIEQYNQSQKMQIQSQMGGSSMAVRRSVVQEVPQGIQRQMRATDAESGQFMTQQKAPLSLQTQFVLQIVNWYMQNHDQIEQKNQNYINQLIMQTLETPAAQLDNEHYQRIQKLDQIGQRLFKQQSELRTNSATVVNESAQRQDDNGQTSSPHQIDAQKNHPVDSQNITKAGQDLKKGTANDTSKQDKQITISKSSQKLPQTQSKPAQQLSNPDQTGPEKTNQIQGHSQNGEIPKFLELLLPTELRTKITSQDDLQTQLKQSNSHNERNLIPNMNYNSQELVMSSLSAFRAQNANETNPSSKQYISMTQTQNRSKPSSNNVNQQKCTNDINHMPPIQNDVTTSGLSQGEQRGADLLKQLLSSSKDLSGLAQMLQSKGLDSQFQNMYTDLKDSTGRDQSSGIACVGSLNTSKGIPSGQGSGISPESGTDSGLKYQEINYHKDQKTNEDKSNGMQDLGGYFGASGNDNNFSGDHPASENHVANQKQGDDTKLSGSREGSKAGTNGSNTMPNGSTDKDTGSNGNGIEKLRDIIENYLPDGKQAMYTDENNNDISGGNMNHLSVNNIMSNIMQGQIQNSSNVKSFLPDSLRANNESGNANSMPFNGISSTIQEELKKLVRQNHSKMSMGQNQSQNNNGGEQQQLNSNSQEDHTHLTTLVKDQAKEISQLKTFILVNMLFGHNNVGDEQSRFTQQLIQDLMLSMMSSGKQAGSSNLAAALTSSIQNGPDFQSNEQPSSSAMADLPPHQNMGAPSNQGPNASNLMQQLLQLQKLQQPSEPQGQILQPKPMSSSIGVSQQQSQIHNQGGKVLGKRGAMQRQDYGQLNQLQNFFNNGEQKDQQSVNTMESDKKAQLLKNKLNMLIGANSLLQDENKNLKQQSQTIKKPKDSTQMISADRRKQSGATHENVPSFLGQKAVSANKSKEMEKQMLIQSIMRKTENSQQRQSDLCATLQQGYLESADHQYEGTSAFLRLKAQIKKNMLAKQFSQMKNEIMCAVNKSHPEQVLIGEKPKRPHHNMGEDSFRGSKFRGVSKNKCKWQMMIMINQKKVYIGAIHTEVEAAKYYDHIAILTQGLHSKTNFAYTAAQLEQIVNDYDFTNEKEGYYDLNSQLTSNFDSKNGTKQNLKEVNFEDYNISNTQMSKRQRVEDGLNIQESSDENQMIGEHLYSGKTLNEGAPNNASQQNIGESLVLDGQLQQKIQQLGFDSISQLLNTMQKQKQYQNTSINHAPVSQNIGQTQNVANMMTSLAGNKSKISDAQQQNDNGNTHRINGQNNNNNSQNSQVIQQILSQYNSFQQSNNAPQVQNESIGNDIQSFQDLRQHLEQSKKVVNPSNTELLMQQKQSPLLKTFANSNNQHLFQMGGNQQFNENQIGSNAAAQFNRQIHSQVTNQQQMKPFHQVAGSSGSAGINLSNLQMNNATASNQINFDSWKAIQSHASRYQGQVGPHGSSVAAQQQSMRSGQAGLVSGGQIQHQSVVQSNMPVDDQIQSMDKMQQQLLNQIQMKENQTASTGMTINNKAQMEQLNQHLLRNLKLKNASAVGADRKDSQQQFASLRQQVPQNQPVVASAHDPYKTPPQKKEDYSTEN